MPKINITEHSDTYSFQVRNNNYATVALPITACWGPAYLASSEDANPDWIHFTAGYKGTTEFMNTFKGPNTYLGTREKSYDYALKLLAAGYDILVKRVDGLGSAADRIYSFNTVDSTKYWITVTAKYPGTYGNNLSVELAGTVSTTRPSESVGTLSVFQKATDTSPRQLLERINVALHPDAESETLPLITEITSNYIEAPVFSTGGTVADLQPISVSAVKWTGVNFPIRLDMAAASGTDYTNRTITGEAITGAAVNNLVSTRVGAGSYLTYITSLTTDDTQVIRLYNQQILYTQMEACIAELTDPISYDWDVLFSAIADDQYMPKSYIDTLANPTAVTYNVTTLTKKMVEVAAQSKCGCAFLGLPFNCTRSAAVDYKDKLNSAIATVYSKEYTTFAELVGPWCKTTLPISGSNAWITPELAHLLLIINAPGIGGINKWWMIPAGMTSTGVAHSPEYKIKKTYLDTIQNHDEGVCFNPLMEVPGKGFTCFGNSTLWNKPLGTYNALQNLSTRLLCNRVKQRIWDVALQILFKYNNENAYSHFYAGLSPLLDEMRSIGALTGNEYNPYGYQIIMNPDIVNLDRINANTVIGKVYLAVTGVIDTVDVDLFLLPPTGFMDTYD